MSDYFHHVPGRIRIKISGLKHRPYKAMALESLFENLPAILSAKASDITGSLLLTYDPDRIDPVELITILRQNGYVDAGRLVNRAKNGAISTKVVRTVGRAAFSWGLGKALESNGLGMLAALI